MIKTFPIDYVRGALEFALFKNRDNIEYFSDDDIKFFTFYEHLASDGEVNRYVETFKKLVEQQNKSSLIGSGIITATSTTSIVNNKQVFACPFEWTCTIRCTLENRDKMLGTLYKVFEELRGRKTDIACLDNGKLQAVGTIGNGVDDYIHDYDYIGSFSEDIITDEIMFTRIRSITTNSNLRLKVDDEKDLYLFIDHKGKLELWKGVYDEDDENPYNWSWEQVDNFIFNHNSFEKMKISLSFTDMRATDPYTLTGTEYFEITFGGGATLTTKNVKLGNDLVKVRIAKDRVVTGNNSSFQFRDGANMVFYTLDPQEKASGNSAGTIENKLKSNNFLTNTHTDSLVVSKQYTFVYNDEIGLLNQWYEYASYGNQNLNSGALQQASMTPNIIYKISEIENSWCDIKERHFDTKIVDDIEINDTDSDIITIGLTMQIQGANN